MRVLTRGFSTTCVLREEERAGAGGGKLFKDEDAEGTRGGEGGNKNEKVEEKERSRNTQKSKRVRLQLRYTRKLFKQANRNLLRVFFKGNKRDFT